MRRQGAGYKWLQRASVVRNGSETGDLVCLGVCPGVRFAERAAVPADGQLSLLQDSNAPRFCKGSSMAPPQPALQPAARLQQFAPEWPSTHTAACFLAAKPLVLLTRPADVAASAASQGADPSSSTEAARPATAACFAASVGFEPAVLARQSVRAALAGRRDGWARRGQLFGARI